MQNEGNMESELKRQRAEAGQAIVLFALMIVGLLAFVGLAIDGGNALNERRITQNAVDASALRGAHYLATADSPTEQELLSRINDVIEDNGLPDTDGIQGNAVNDNVQVFYTDDQGVRLVSPNCSVAGTCGVGGTMGTPPLAAFGVEVEATNPVDTFLLGIIGQDNLDIGGEAVAVRRGTDSNGLGQNVMVSLGQCATADRQLTGRGNDNEFLGSMHSNSYFDSTGSNNHYHGQVTAVNPYYRPPGDATVYEPGDPAVGAVVSDPYAGWAYTDFAPGTAIATANAGAYWDASKFDDPAYGGDADGIIEMREITQQTYYGTTLYNPDDKKTVNGLKPNQMRSGIYYAGDKEIRIGEKAAPGKVPQGTNGTITVVSGNRIKITEKAVNFTAYMGQGSAFPGLLFFSDYAIQADPCDFDTSIDPVINMAGNDSGLKSEVYHYDYDLPKGAVKADYVDCPYPKVNGCYVPSNSLYTGLIYAPNGRVDTSDSDTTYLGVIIAYTIDFSGNNNLFVHNTALASPGGPMIFLER